MALQVNIKLYYLISVLSLLMQFIQGMPLEPDASHHNRKDISQIFLRTAAVNKPYEELLIYQDDSIVGTRDKRFSSGRNGFESDIFSDGFGQFDTMKKRFYGKNGFHDDIFSNGFGSFGTMKRSFGKPGFESDNFDYRFGPFSPKKRLDQDN
ncbi:uncharacterized protein LOC136040768 [Artemia franciscana]|uniref:uncharacterized protein LOC136040768 n=1 Tax=Artemia franciscana TaxID=6661 RepID=UPI0032DB73FC